MECKFNWFLIPIVNSFEDLAEENLLMQLWFSSWRREARLTENFPGLILNLILIQFLQTLNSPVIWKFQLIMLRVYLFYTYKALNLNCLNL